LSAGVQDFSERIGLKIPRFRVIEILERTNVPATMTRALSVALALVLAACGGGSDEPTVMRAPLAPVVPPAASAAAGVSTFPSASPPTRYETTYAGGGGNVSSVIVNGVRRVGGLQAPIQIDRDRISYPITHFGSSGWMVDVNGFEQVGFAPSNLFAPTSTLFDSFHGPNVGLDIAKPGAGGLSLIYSGLALYASADHDFQRMGFTFLAVGSATPLGPPPGVIGPYIGIADGYWFDGTTTRRLFGSPARVTIDSAGVRTVVLELRGHDDAFGAFESASTTMLGTVFGVAENFSGAGGYTGGFSGLFFGPNAEELGIAFTLTGPGDARVFGVVVARR
jgi:hypothetical protein